MKRNIAAFALFAATIIALATHASAQEQPFQANVPFNFTVGNRQLPLGFYRIRTLSTRQVQIENMQHDISASTLVIPRLGPGTMTRNSYSTKSGVNISSEGSSQHHQLSNCQSPNQRSKLRCC
jgi:hypothetical protein